MHRWTGLKCQLDALIDDRGAGPDVAATLKWPGAFAGESAPHGV